MAGRRRRTTEDSAVDTSRRYRTNGNAAYLAQPSHRQEKAPHHELPERHSRTQPREKLKPRPKADVRPREGVSLFAVAGTAAVLVCTMLLVMMIAQLAVANNDIVALQDQLTELQEENQQMQAEYEQAFDLDVIEEMFLSNGTMVRPSADQTIYLDLAGEDSVVYYSNEPEGVHALIQQASNLLDGFLAG